MLYVHSSELQWITFAWLLKLHALLLSSYLDMAQVCTSTLKIAECVHLHVVM